MILTLIHIWEAGEKVALKEQPKASLTHPHSSLPPRPHPRTRSQPCWVGSPWGRRTGSHLLCSHTGHRRRAGGFGHTHPHLGKREPVGLRKGPGPNHLHCYHHLPQHSSLEAVSWARLIPPPGSTDSFSVPPLMVCPAARVKLGYHLLHVALPSSGLPPPRAAMSTISFQKECRMESILIGGERGEDSGVRPSPPSQYLHSSASVLHHPVPSPCLSAPQPCPSPIPTANGDGMSLDSVPSPWHGAPGPRERKPAGQAQWKEPAVLSQRPGPQGGGSWAHSSTSSSHAEPRKPAGQTQRKEPDRFSQTPLPQRPGLCVHSSTSAQGKGPRVTHLCCPTPLCSASPP